MTRLVIESSIFLFLFQSGNCLKLRLLWVFFKRKLGRGDVRSLPSGGKRSSRPLGQPNQIKQVMDWNALPLCLYDVSYCLVLSGAIPVIIGSKDILSSIAVH
ncbi:MAG: hypothetical protein CMQ17_06000 [Gammaproteobacteria bacterium]|nr:hypothetical protein [Gammaproteobacteria bacterium]